jgi:hypothetical protein
VTLNKPGVGYVIVRLPVTTILEENTLVMGCDFGGNMLEASEHFLLKKPKEGERNLVNPNSQLQNLI